jgi:hypothetical protein
MGYRRSIIIRFLVVGAALLSPFFFPIILTIGLALLGAAVSAWIPLTVGILLDALYWNAGVEVPLATLVGAIGSIIAFLVHRFVKTSIIHA